MTEEGRHKAERRQKEDHSKVGRQKEYREMTEGRQKTVEDRRRNNMVIRLIIMTDLKRTLCLSLHQW